MHILEIPSFMPPHGGLFCLEQAKALKALGHEVRILSCTQLGLSTDKGAFLTLPWDRRWQEMEGVEMYGCYLRGWPKVVRQNMERWVKTVQQMYREYCRKYGKPDVLHAHCCKWAGVAARRISKEEGIPYFVTEHLSSVLFKKDFGETWSRNIWAKDLLRETYENAACVIPVAEELVEDLSPFFGKDYRWEAVSNIIDTDFFHFQPRERKGRGYRICCLAVANIEAKGYDVLAEAFGGMKNTTAGEYPIELHIAGRGTDGREMQELFAPVPHVTLHGMLDKEGVRKLLYDCDGLVLASRSEAQPLVVLEAMSTGMTVVATEVVPQSERFDKGIRIVPVGDAEALKSAMIEMAEKAEPASILLSDEVRHLASPQAIANRLTQLFERYK